MIGNAAPRRPCEYGAMRRFIVDWAFPGVFQPATAYCQNGLEEGLAETLATYTGLILE